MGQTFLNAFSLRANLRHLFYRPSSSMPAVDGLRAVSVVWVILFHSFFYLSFCVPVDVYVAYAEAAPWYLEWFWKGELAVDIFFVISGFLITQILLREYTRTARIDYRKFYWRRYLRLTPAYFIVLLIYYSTGAKNAANVWANALYINNFLSFREMPLAWTWTLAVEEQFYLLFPVLLVGMMKSGRPIFWLGAGFIASFFITALLLASEPTLWQSTYAEQFFNRDLWTLMFDTVYDKLYTRYGGFICGAVAAYALTINPDAVRAFLSKSFSRHSLLLLSGMIIVGLLIIPTHKPSAELSLVFNRFYAITEHNFFSAAIAILLVLCSHPTGLCRRINQVLSWYIFYPLAQLSYSLYLVHMTVIALVYSNVKANLELMHISIAEIGYGGIFGVFLISLIISTLLASMLYLFIERPFMNLRKKTRPGQIAPGKWVSTAS